MGITSITPASAPYATSNVDLTITIGGIPSGKNGVIIRLTFGDTQHVDYRVTWPTTTSGSASTRDVTSMSTIPLASGFRAEQP